MVICFFIYYPHISCSAALCPDPPVIINGMRTFTGNSIGDTANYTCDPEFELIGIAITTCTAAVDGNSATFPPVPPPECRREYCIKQLFSYMDSLYALSVEAFFRPVGSKFRLIRRGSGAGKDRCRCCVQGVPARGVWRHAPQLDFRPSLHRFWCNLGVK